MQFKWTYRYVPDGTITPDRFNRWAIDCYIFVDIDKALPDYKWYKELTNKSHIPVRVATMFQKGTENGRVPSLIDKFGACTISFKDAGNTGMSNERFFYSNDIDTLKAIIEDEFKKTRNVFMNCL